MWGKEWDSNSALHFFIYDGHPKFPLLISLCGRYGASDLNSRDLNVGYKEPEIAELKLKKCGNCEFLTTATGMQLELELDRMIAEYEKRGNHGWVANMQDIKRVLMEYEIHCGTTSSD